MTTYTATYSCADNKLRLRASSRLDAETYARVKAAGFSWAPKQELFVAPKWTPDREDLLLDLCEEIEDEDITPEERAHDRAERFEYYSDKRETDAHRAKDEVARISDGIPLGQPILRGHHSERRARKDAEKIENGMRKAVKMWETSKYWERRAAGAIRAAKYKERPDVRARRIKTLEAELRKVERSGAGAAKEIELWTKEGLTWARARAIANYSRHCNLWSELDKNTITPEEARDRTLPRLERLIEHARRCSEHLKMRLIYERCMLEESGYVEEPKQKSAKQTLPLCNYRAETIKSPSRYHRGQIDEFPQVEMTKAEYAKIYKDHKGTRIVDNSHKVRIAVIKSSYVAVFLTDSKVHAKPAPVAPPAPPPPAPRMPPAPRPAPEPTVFDAMKDSLKAGVRVVSAPQLFPTSHELAIRMARKADIRPGHVVLEPSAGTGRLIWAIKEVCAHGIELHAVEINDALARKLREGETLVALHQGDFLEMDESELGAGFDRVVMNPPFSRGADVAHILHAISMLKPGGRLVTLCANGSRQSELLQPLADSWEELPDGSFAAEGTNVSVVLATFTKSEAA